MDEKGLPDFNDLLELANNIGFVETKLIKAKYLLDELLATITAEVTNNEKHWVNNKVPSMSYIEKNYHQLGYDEQTKKELQTKREAVADLTGELSALKSRFLVLRDMISVWQTHQANQRATMI